MKMRKNISLYDAEKKKNTTVNLCLEDFESEKAMLEHIELLRTLQKAKNKEYKEAKQLLVDMPTQIVSLQQYIEPVSSLFGNIVIENDLKLKLDPKTGNSTCIFGSSKRGKSSLLMHIYNKYYRNDKDFISTLFSINSHISIYGGDNKLLKSNCFNTRSEKYIKLQKYINGKTKNKYKFLDMFDDIIDMKYTKLINQLILTYRNSKISTIMCLQYGYLLNKMNRANVNNVIIFGANSNEAIQDLITTFLKPYFVRLGYKNYDEQIALFKYVTDNYGFFYIHPLSDSISFHRIIL